MKAEEVEEARVVSACGFDSAFDGAFGFAGVGVEEVERPVELVFHSPAAAHGGGE